MRIWLGVMAVALIAVPVAAAQVSVPMALVTEQGVGATIGTVALMDSPGGLVMTPDLAGLPPGGHGFHVHARGDCGVTLPEGKPVPAGAAGGHFDPQGTGTHLGPAGTGHLGDLPVLEVVYRWSRYHGGNRPTPHGGPGPGARARDPRRG